MAVPTNWNSALTALIVATALTTAAAPAASAPDPVAAANIAFNAKRYQEAYQTLLTYRASHPATRQIDFMLGVSACNLAGKKAWGLTQLQTAANRWGPAEPAFQPAFNQAILACTPTATAIPVVVRPGVTIFGAAPGSDIRAHKYDDRDLEVLREKPLADEGLGAGSKISGEMASPRDARDALAGSPR